MPVAVIKKQSKFAKLDKNSKKHSNDPFIVKKVNSAKKLLATLRLPKELKS